MPTGNLAKALASTVLVGGSALVAALTLDFGAMAKAGVLDPRLTWVGASLSTVVDQTGRITYPANNLVLNSAALATQNVTTRAHAYILSFKGTGSVTLSGTSTAGPLVGTGEADRVYLRFTPTAGTLTLTVAGTVTEAQVEAVTYQTTPRSYNATIGAVYHGPRFTFDPTTLDADGIFAEPSRTNKVVNSGSMTEANFPYRTNNATTAPDGTNTATLIRSAVAATGAGGLAYTFGAGLQGISIFAKWVDTAASYFGAYDTVTNGFVTFVRVDWSASGVPTPSIIIGSGTLVATAFPNGWYRFTLSYTGVSGNSAMMFIYPESGSDVACTGKGLYYWGAQIEDGYPTSYIPTSGATATRAVSYASLPTSNLYQLEGAWLIDFKADRLIDGASMVMTYGPGGAGSYMELSNSVAWAGGGTSLPGIKVGRNAAMMSYNTTGSQSATMNGIAGRSTTSSDYTGAATSVYFGNRSLGDLSLGGTIRKAEYFSQLLALNVQQRRTGARGALATSTGKLAMSAGGGSVGKRSAPPPGRTITI